MSTRLSIVDSYERLIDRRFLLPEVSTISEIGRVGYATTLKHLDEFTYPVFGGVISNGPDIGLAVIQTPRQVGRAVRVKLLNKEIGFFTLGKSNHPDFFTLTVSDPSGLTNTPVALIEASDFYKTIELL